MKIKLICFIALMFGCGNASDAASDHCIKVGQDLVSAFHDFNGDAGQQGWFHDDYSCAVLTGENLQGIQLYGPYNPTAPVCESMNNNSGLLISCRTNLTGAQMAGINLSVADLLHEQKTHRLVLWDECDSI